MQSRRNKLLPNNWKIQFVRASALKPVFADNSLDVIFSATTFHHISPYDIVIEWISKSLKHNGLFILNDFSDRNPSTVIGRKLLHGFLMEGKKHVYTNEIKELASKYYLELVYEKGLYFLTGLMQYMGIGLLNLPRPVAIFVYRIARFFDYFVTSPLWNFSFIQIYRKR